MMASKYKYFDLEYIEKYELGLEHLRKVGRDTLPQLVKSSSRVGSAIRESGGGIGVLVGINVEKFPKPDLTRW